MPKMTQNANAFVLCAGEQKRFGGTTSKMMFEIRGRPAISYTLETLLVNFRQSDITIISSHLFDELNNYISQFFPQIGLVIDSCPGSGTANSFRTAFGRWRKEVAFVTAGDIWYSSRLVSEMLEAINLKKPAQVVMSVTKQTTVIPSHRAISSLEPFAIAAFNDPCFVPEYRNVGVYAIRRTTLPYFDGQGSGLMEILIAMQAARELLIPVVYDGELLHTGCRADQDRWRDYFNQSP